MDAVRELFGTLTTIQWRDVLDILLVTYLIYRVVLLVRSTSAMRIAKGFMAILVISAVTQIQELWTLNFLLGHWTAGAGDPLPAGAAADDGPPGQLRQPAPIPGSRKGDGRDGYGHQPDRQGL